MCVNSYALTTLVHTPFAPGLHHRRGLRPHPRLSSPSHNVREVRIVHKLHRAPAVGRKLVSFHEVGVALPERPIGQCLFNRKFRLPGLERRRKTRGRWEGFVGWHQRKAWLFFLHADETSIIPLFTPFA